MMTLNYPVFFFSENDIGLFDEKEFGVVGKPFLAEEIYLKRKILDRNGNLYGIVGLTILSNGSKWPQLLTRPSRRIYKVRFELGVGIQSNIEEIKPEVYKRLRSQRLSYKWLEKVNSFDDLYRLAPEYL